MKMCYWCEEKEGTVYRSYPSEFGHYCEGCSKKLDKWSKEDWDEFYEGLHEANTSDLNYWDDSSTQKFKEEIRKQSLSRTCIICGVDRNQMNCNCNR